MNENGDLKSKAGYSVRAMEILGIAAACSVDHCACSEQQLLQRYWTMKVLILDTARAPALETLEAGFAQWSGAARTSSPSPTFLVHLVAQDRSGQRSSGCA